MKKIFDELKKQIETLNIKNEHKYRDLVDCLDLMESYQSDKVKYQELKNKFTNKFMELGLYSSHKQLLDLL